MTKKKLFLIVVFVILLVAVVVVVVHHRRQVVAQQNSQHSISTTTTGVAATSAVPISSKNLTTSPAIKSGATGSVLLGESDHTLSYGGLTRAYTVYVPKNYTAATTYPLVVLLHGGDGNGSNAISKLASSQPAGKRFLTDSKFEVKADANNFIVVAPEGYQGNWNDGRTGTEPAKLGTDDAGFIAAVVVEIEKTYSINQKKVFATGMSNGGTMSYKLACSKPDVFTAVAGVSASTVKTVAASCTVAVPILGIQGTLDPLMTFDGGPSKFAKQMGSDPSVPSQMEPAMDNMQFWAKNNGCSQTPVVTRMPTVVDDGTSVDKYTFGGCKTLRAVEYYVVNGMGHAWPPNQKAMLVAITGPGSGNINATDVVWEFFNAHSK